MSNDERRVFWVRPHVRKRADGTEYQVKGYFVGGPNPGPGPWPCVDEPPEGDEGESQ